SFMNINGYVKETRSGPEFSIGERVSSLKDYFSLNESSRPLWYTHKQAPVHILGGIPKNKVILLSDTGFDDYFLIEVAIDSCWISSQKCPWDQFSSSIYDAIATESTLFVRQNQLVYYFTGNYSALYMNTSGSELWTRILAKQCVRKLNPVDLTKNNTEYVIALGGGWQEGEFFVITVSEPPRVLVGKDQQHRGSSERPRGLINLQNCFLFSPDGIVKHAASSRKSACTVLKRRCILHSVVFDIERNSFFLLVETNLESNASTYYIMAYRQGEDGHYEVLSVIPQFIPEASDQGFVVLIGQEKYTDIPMVPKGIAYNPSSLIFYVWGNMILQSNDLRNYLYLSDFTGDSAIKYFIQSYSGELACVTEDEQVWISHEGSSIIRKIYPSRAWELNKNLQIMGGSAIYQRHESRVTVFFDRHNLLELVYMEDDLGRGKLIKREFPQRYILTYSHIIDHPHRVFSDENKDYIKFSHTCPFAWVRIVGLPPPQRFTRKEHYRTEPPDIMEKTGFHDKKSLTVYQGLIFQLLWLHSAYNRPYADPVHDPTWRWWKNKAEDAQYYFYVASNRNSSGGVYVNMANYVKVYNIVASNALPETIYLDRNSIYNFSVFFSIRTKEQSLGESAEENSLDYVWLTIIVAHPEYVNVFMDRKELISRGSVLYKVTVMDTGIYPRQDLSGKKLLRSSMIFSVANAVTRCYDHSPIGPVIKGYRVLPVIIGCPPGRRLAFDITGTLQYSIRKNKRYFDCVNPDPEMPCFFFSDVFYPSFLIQDMVTGDSGPFKGRWVCQEHSPCYDILPRDMLAPEYFFVIRVTNRGVDQTTYCDYALEFVIHVHGLRLSPTRAIFLMKVSMSSVVGMVFLYMAIYILGPRVRALWSRVVRRFEEAVVLRTGSSLTFSSSVTSRGSQNYLATLSEFATRDLPPAILIDDFEASLSTRVPTPPSGHPGTGAKPDNLRLRTHLTSRASGERAPSSLPLFCSAARNPATRISKQVPAAAPRGSVLSVGGSTASLLADINTADPRDPRERGRSIQRTLSRASSFSLRAAVS
ncbi:PREDICTED: cation channel sperm-associated protein subunit gamma-like, partial [Gekko japonicus]|uniref:Cation channel sperm-associated protein subunit gamma-like n=1 Tax=Gekko japonicus TaxID=146911 RepID=A0ABM1KH14_GEKJA